MGQYYNVYVKTSTSERIFCPHNAVFMAKYGYANEKEMPDRKEMPEDVEKDFWDMMNGLKIMEHSWVKNDFCDGVYGILANQPALVVWCGDYANSDSDKSCVNMRTRHPELKEVYLKCYGEYSDDPAKEIPPVPSSPFDFVPEIKEGEKCHAEYGYLLNYDRNEYVDLEAYCKRVYDTQEHHKDWIPNPLSLLCAYGNGQGGGDYFSDHDADLVGRWAYEELAWAETLPPEWKDDSIYAELKPTFYEDD